MNPIEALLVEICGYLAPRPCLAEILDATRPFRRMDRPVERGWRNIVAYGRPVPRKLFPRRPLFAVTVAFQPLIRGEAEGAAMGDFLLSRVVWDLMRAFDDETPVLSCDDFVLKASQFDNFSTEPELEKERAAWTQRLRFRFDIVVPSCRGALETCYPC